MTWYNRLNTVDLSDNIIKGSDQLNDSFVIIWPLCESYHVHNKVDVLGTRKALWDFLPT